MKMTPIARYAILLTAAVVLGLDPVRAILLAIVFAGAWTMLVDKKAWVYMGGHPADFPPQWVDRTLERMSR